MGENPGFFQTVNSGGVIWSRFYRKNLNKSLKEFI